MPTGTLEVTFKLLFIRNECLNVLFVNQNFLRERKPKALALCFRSTGIAILDIVNDQETVLPTCKEEIVIVTHAHSLDGLAVSLNLIELSKLRHLINVD